MSQLLLFDIDGTLIHHYSANDAVHPNRAVRVERFVSAVKHAFGVDAQFDKSRFSGMTDRQIIWEMVKGQVPREVFEEKFRHIGPHMHELLKKASEIQPLYEPIDSAVTFLQRVASDDRFCLGIITGNVESIAKWKLDSCGLAEYFRFGLYGDEADDRIELAHKTLTRARAFFHEQFVPEDVIVIGDTVYDVRAGKAIGARIVAVTTGGSSREEIASNHPDLITESLLSSQALTFFGLAGAPTGAV